MAQLDGTFVRPSKIPSLKVAVIGGKADHFTDETKLSVYRDYRVLYEITADRPGGAGPEDQLFADTLTYRG